MTTKQQTIKDKLLQCPEMTVADLAEATGASSDYVRAALRRLGMRAAPVRGHTRPRRISIRQGFRCSVCHNTGHLERAN